MSESPEIIATHGKSIVVRVPGRRFPGLWIPADTVSTWLDVLSESPSDPEATNELADELRAMLNAYASDLRALAEPLPFEWPSQGFGQCGGS